jgi:hypothetical protein
MQAKYNALEGRSKDLLLSQGSAVSGADVALVGLQNRIEHLVEQLVSSYNISEQDLEVSQLKIFSLKFMCLFNNNNNKWMPLLLNTLTLFFSVEFCSTVNNAVMLAIL